MLGSLRGGAERLHGELDAIVDGAARLAAAGDAVEVAPAVAPTALGATLGAAPAVADEEVEEEPAGAAVGEPPSRRTDVDGARIVVLEWATTGKSREEIARHLAEHYDLPIV